MNCRYIKPLMLAVAMLFALMSADMARPTPGDDTQEVSAIQFAGSIAQDVLALEVSERTSFDLMWSFESPLASLSEPDGQVYGDLWGGASGAPSKAMIREQVPRNTLDGRGQRNAPMKEPRSVRL